MKITKEQAAPAFHPLSVTFTVETLDELRSLRALFGGAIAEDIIESSSTPEAPKRVAGVFTDRVSSILNDACDEAGVEW